MKKATAIAPSNIAFIKYWGKKDEVLRLPENGSISMNLSNLNTTTTVEFDEKLKKDSLTINGEKKEEWTKRATKHLDRIRKLAKIKTFAKVMSNNNFPSSTGLSSSASGYAALSVAAAAAAGLSLGTKELSILARQGSGSACRSIPDGIVEWLDGDTSDSSYAKTLYKPNYWDLRDVVAVVSDEKKYVSTTEGQKAAASSPFYATRLKNVGKKIREIKKYMKKKDFKKFGELVEAEALELHAIMLTSTPALVYWLPNTVRIMRAVLTLRRDGLPVYFTINTGQDVHLIVQKKDVDKLTTKLKKIEGVKNVIINNPSYGTKLSSKHLF